MGVAERLGQRGQLRQPFQAIAGTAAASPVRRPGGQQAEALLRRRRLRQRDLDDPQDLLGCVRGERGRRRPRWRNGRTPLRRRPRARDERGAAASPAPARRSAAAGRSPRGSRAGEPAPACLPRIRGPARGGSCSPPARPRAAPRAARPRRRAPSGRRARPDRPPAHPPRSGGATSRRSFKLKLRPMIAASASAVLVSIGRCAARRWISVRTAEGASRSALRVKRPGIRDLLQHPGLAVGAADLLDDERDTLRLAVDRRGGRGVDLPAENLPEELRRLHHREPRELQPPDHAHPLHVGEQRHRLGERGDLLGADREHQEDRARAFGPDDVPEETEAVLVRPLHVVDQQAPAAARW